jgi:hypothetical protein
VSQINTLPVRYGLTTQETFSSQQTSGISPLQALQTNERGDSIKAQSSHFGLTHNPNFMKPNFHSKSVEAHLNQQPPTLKAMSKLEKLLA